MTQMSQDTRMLIAVRVVVVTTLLLAALIIQYTVREVLPLNYLYITAGRDVRADARLHRPRQLIPSRVDQPHVQIGGDLVVETLLVYFTGGLDSPFSFLYLVSIITASMLLYRRGGLLAASGRVDPLRRARRSDVLRRPSAAASSRSFSRSPGPPRGSTSTWPRTSPASTRRRCSRPTSPNSCSGPSEELDANRQNLAELRALNQNVVESIPSGLITLSSVRHRLVRQSRRCAASCSSEPLSILGRHVTELGFFTVEDWNDAREELDGGEVVRREIDDFIVGGVRRSIGFAVSPLSTLEGKVARATRSSSRTSPR